MPAEISEVLVWAICRYNYTTWQDEDDGLQLSTRDGVESVLQDVNKASLRPALQYNAAKSDLLKGSLMVASDPCRVSPT